MNAPGFLTEAAGLHERDAGLDWPSVAEIRLCAVGLPASEQDALARTMDQSLEHPPVLRLLPDHQFGAADVILIDGANRRAQAWWQAHREKLSQRAVVWIDQDAACAAHTTVVRPVVWRMLPLVLHRAVQSAPPRELPLAARSLQPSAPAVMVLATDKALRAKLSWMLESLGRRATLAGSAREGLAALHAASYDCVILAEAGLDLDASEICRRIRSLKRRIGRLPVILLEDRPRGWDRLRARVAGCDEIARRPHHSQELQALLDRHVAPRTGKTDPD